MVMSSRRWAIDPPDEGGSRGIQRTCADCLETFYMSRDEPYQIRVCCPDCQTRAKLRQIRETNRQPRPQAEQVS
jgi:hypothetical protein